MGVVYRTSSFSNITFPSFLSYVPFDTFHARCTLKLFYTSRRVQVLVVSVARFPFMALFPVVTLQAFFALTSVSRLTGWSYRALRTDQSLRKCFRQLTVTSILILTGCPGVP